MGHGLRVYLQYQTRRKEKTNLRHLNARPNVSNTEATSVWVSKQYTIPYSISTINKYQSHATQFGSQVNQHKTSGQMVWVLHYHFFAILKNISQELSLKLSRNDNFLF